VAFGMSHSSPTSRLEVLDVLDTIQAMSVRDSTLFLFIDIDNVYYCEDAKRLSDRIAADIAGVVTTQSQNWVPARMLVRLYGGWMCDGELTRMASRTLEATSRAHVFPFFCTDHYRTIVRGQIDLALEMLSLPGLLWQHTCSIQKGAPRLRTVARGTPKDCPTSKDACFISQMARFSQSKYSRCPHPGCTVMNVDAFQQLVQKMVDSLMICDLLYLAANPADNLAVAVATDDWDILPGLALAASSGLDVRWLRRNLSRMQTYDNALTQLGVRIATWG